MECDFCASSCSLWDSGLGYCSGCDVEVFRLVGDYLRPWDTGQVGPHSGVSRIGLGYSLPVVEVLIPGVSRLGLYVPSQPQAIGPT